MREEMHEAIYRDRQQLAERGHSWEIITMTDGRRVKRCSVCCYSYEFGHDLPCPGVIDRALEELLTRAEGAASDLESEGYPQPELRAAIAKCRGLK